MRQARTVRGGLRLQILMLLGGLLLLSFIPLFFAVATYTSLTLQQVRQKNARALGRAIAGHVSEARARRSTDELMTLLDAEIGGEGVRALGVYDQRGKPLARAGHPDDVGFLPQTSSIDKESVTTLATRRGPALLVTIPDSLGSVVALVPTDDDSARSGPLIRLMGLYTLVVALSLLVLAYFALTHLIVRPVDQLSRAAERVAGGARRLEVPTRAPRELSELAQSFKTMTERLLAEEQALKHKVDDYERATAHLKEAQDRLIRSERLASVGRLAAGLAHEVGNPIAALIGLLDLLLEGDLGPDEQRDFLQRMRRETERIHHILRDLLQFSRPGKPTDGQHAEPGDVETAIYDTMALIAPQKAVKDVELSLDVFPDLPPVALSREQLVQVILNLTLNAADACRPGGTVRVSARASENGVEIAVEDNGPGVLPEIQDRLFEPFVTSKEVGKGTGLGLAVCRGLVESVAGSIALDADYREGARFVVLLPRAKS